MSVLNKFFDKIYCINLDSRLDRWSECLKQFEIKDIENFDRITPCDVSNEKPVGVNRYSEWSLIRTHEKIIKDAIKNGFEKILILEDDFEICDLHTKYYGKSFEDRFEEGISLLPNNWDMIFLGNSTITQDFTSVVGEIYKLGFSHTAHAVGINSKIYNKILEIIPQSEEPIDIMYSRLMREYNIYGFKPNLISQRPSFSNLAMRNVDYEELRDYL
jgi:hypothetical protein